MAFTNYFLYCPNVLLVLYIVFPKFIGLRDPLFTGYLTGPVFLGKLWFWWLMLLLHILFSGFLLASYILPLWPSLGIGARQMQQTQSELCSLFISLEADLLLTLAFSVWDYMTYPNSVHFWPEKVGGWKKESEYPHRPTLWSLGRGCFR